jgi:predicted RND superfamily exporter protein
VAFDAQDRPRAQYKFVIPDASSVVILIRPREALSNEGVERLVTRIRRTVLEAHLAKVAVTITGGPALAAGLAGTVRSELPRLAILATGVVGILFLLTGSGPRGRRLVPLVCALIATGVTLSLFGLTGHPIALGMLALLPVLLGVGSDFPVYLARASSRRTVIVAGLASSASCASLWLSPVPFVRGLGVALALGILCSLTLGLCLMKRCDNHDARPRLAGRTTKPLPRRRAMIAAASLAALFGWLALPGLTVESDPDKVAQGVPALAQVKIAEQALGTSGEMDVVLRGPDVLSPTALAWQNRALAAIVTTYGDQVRLVASPATFLTFLGDHPTAAQITAGADLLPAYLLGAVVTPDRSQALTSYGVQLTDVAHQGKIFRDIQHVLPAPPSGYTTAITGLPVLAAQGYESLSANRFVSNLLGLALAGGVLLVGLPHRKDGLRALLASGLAIGWGLLILKVAGVPLTPLTTSLGSLTAAVGCEFVAVAAVARRQGNGLGERGVALAASSSTLGYLVLVASGLAIMRSFGLVLASSMVLAYAATQFVLRAFPVVDVMDQEPQAHRVDLVMETVV